LVDKLLNALRIRTCLREENLRAVTAEDIG